MATTSKPDRTFVRLSAKALLQRTECNRAWSLEDVEFVYWEAYGLFAARREELNRYSSGPPSKEKLRELKDKFIVSAAPATLPDKEKET